MTPKGGLDETSMVIGELRSSVGNIEKANDAIFRELRDIRAEMKQGREDSREDIKEVNDKVTNQRVKIGAISAIVSLITGYLMYWIKGGGSS